MVTHVILMIIGIRGSLCFTLKAACFGNWFSEVSLFDWIRPSFQHPRQWRDAMTESVLLTGLSLGLKPTELRVFGHQIRSFRNLFGEIR